jgi:hypothetical protein
MADAETADLQVGGKSPLHGQNHGRLRLPCPRCHCLTEGYPQRSRSTASLMQRIDAFLEWSSPRKTSCPWPADGVRPCERKRLMRLELRKNLILRAILGDASVARKTSGVDDDKPVRCAGCGAFVSTYGEMKRSSECE